MTHHYALAVADENEQHEWRKRLAQAGYRVSPIADRIYFRSIYYSNDPDGHIVELAAVGPSFLVDESEESLGQKLMLLPWLEKHRTQIENHLTPLIVPEWKVLENV